MGPSWSMVKFHSILRSHPGAIFRFFVGLKKMGFSDRIQRQKWFFHPPPKIMDDILEFPSTIEKQVLDSCCFIHRCFEASWCFFFEKTFNVSFFLCFRFFCFSSLPRLEQKNNHMFFFQWGIRRFFASDPDPTTGFIWTPTRPWCLGSGRDCWRYVVGGRGGGLACFGARRCDDEIRMEIWSHFFLLEDIFFWNNGFLVKSGIYILCSRLL